MSKFDNILRALEELEAVFRHRQTVEVDTRRFSYREPSPPPYYDDYYKTVEDEYRDYYTESERDDEYLEPEIDDVRCPCCSHSHRYDDGVCEVFLENPTYWSAKIKAAVSASWHRGYLSSKYLSETEGDDEYETLEDKELEELEETLSEVEEYLLSPDLSSEVRIRGLTQKCQVLERKIYLEECSSPLPANMKELYQTEEEIMEDKSISRIPVGDTEFLGNQELMVESKVKPFDEVKVCPKSEPLLEFVKLIIKCEEGRESRIMLKATWQDFGAQLILQIKRLSQLNMPSCLKNLTRWYVNYRAYLGNVKGKCALKPP